MAKYIDAVECADIISDKLNISLGDLVDVFSEVPTADVVEVKHGRWIKVYQNNIAIVYECSRCKHLTLGTSDYCICGAKMDGKEVSE